MENDGWLMLNPSYACRLDLDFPSVIPANAGIQVTDSSVIPLKNGIQILGMGMDPGFHRGDDSAGMTEFYFAMLRGISTVPIETLTWTITIPLVA